MLGMLIVIHNAQESPNVGKVGYVPTSVKCNHVKLFSILNIISVYLFMINSN